MLTDIHQIFEPKELVGYLTERKPEKLLGEVLFPEEKHDTIEFEVFLDASNHPIMASVHAFDTEAEIGSREAQKMALDAVLIKRKLQLKEKDLIMLKMPRYSKEETESIRSIFNDVDILTAGVRARVEAMRMEILANGTLTLDENGLDMVVDYHVKPEHKIELTGSDAWDADDTEADILLDFEAWVALPEFAPKYALTSNTVVASIIRNEKLRCNILGKHSYEFLTLEKVNAYFKKVGLPEIITYDQSYRKQNADGTYSTHRFFPKNKIALLPDIPVGKTLYGPTPDELSVFSGTQENLFKSLMIYAAMYEEGKDPIATWVKASAVAIPSLKDVNNIVQIKPIQKV